MKIYNKKGFREGVAILVLSTFLLKACFKENIDFKDLIWGCIGLLLGIRGVLRGFSSTKSREDILINNDEREQYIDLLTAKKTLKILHIVNWVLLIVFVLAYGYTKAESLIVVCIVLGLLYTISLLIEFAVNIYYDTTH